MGKKTSNVSDKIISLGKTLVGIATECGYCYCETDTFYTYDLYIATKEFDPRSGKGIVFELSFVGQHKWRIGYLHSYKDEDLSYHCFKDNEMDYNKEVSVWTKYIQNYSKKIKKKSIFDREQKIKEDF